MSKKRNFFLAGIVAAGLAAVGIKTAADRRKQADDTASETLSHKEDHSDVGATKATDEGTSDSSGTPAASDSYPDHRNIPRPGAL